MLNHGRCKAEAPRCTQLYRNPSVWKEAKRSIVTGVLLAALFAAFLAGYVRLMPPLPDGHWAVLSRFPPMSISQLVAQRNVVQSYAAEHLAWTLTGYTLVYVFMQTFAFPGTVSLSMLAGGLFGAVQGLLLVAVVSTLGSCACFGLSRLIGRGLAHALWPERLQAFRQEVDRRRGELLGYIVFLRITPILPNIFINIASPVVNVPIGPFALGTLVGCLPNNFVAVNAGSKLGELKSLADLYDIRLIMLGGGVGVLAMLSVAWKHFAGKQEQVNFAKEA